MPCDGCGDPLAGPIPRRLRGERNGGAAPQSLLHRHGGDLRHQFLRLPAGVPFTAEKKQGQAQSAHEEGKLPNLANQLAVEPVGIHRAAVLGVVLVACDDPGHRVLADDNKGIVAPDDLPHAAPGRGRPAMQQERLGMQLLEVDAAGTVAVPDEHFLHAGLQQTVYRGVDLAGHQALAGIVVASIRI